MNAMTNACDEFITFKTKFLYRIVSIELCLFLSVFSPFHRSPVSLLPILHPFHNPAILPNYVTPFVISGSARLRPKYHYLWRERNIFIQTNRPYQGLFISTKGNVPLSD